MPRVSTFCPRCGETIETDVSDEARAQGRAALTCPACRFDFVIAPARPGSAPDAPAPPAAAPPAPADAPPGAPPAPLSPPPAGPATVLHAPRDPRAAPSFKPVAAALLLLFASLLGIWIASLLFFSDDFVRSAFDDLEGETSFSGRVEDADGAALADVQVTLLENTTRADVTSAAAVQNTTTDAGGAYRFDNVSAGIRWFRFEKAGFETVYFESPVYPPEYPRFLGDPAAIGLVEMQEGDGVDRRSVVNDFETIVPYFAGAVALGAALAVAGAVACFRRRGLWLAVLGSFGAVLAWGFFVNWFLAPIVWVLLYLARREFQSMRKEPPAAPHL